MPRLENEIDELRKALDAERDARVSAEQASAVARAKVEAAMDARNAAERALEEAKQHQQATDVELSTVRSEVKDAQTALATLQGGIEASGRPRARLPLPGSRPRKKT